ncbi:AMP-binding protein [Bacillus gobiensis]|uniref:Long-chain fatty acid--CoA ligase n=1 Tax=Bacillus gobiensis TaxID=1441095 RepID=A0A0M4FU88_9BACI|nr:AMP-binding protein [Bacillus gobiensis]ALC81905.1 long-chain fatty acid--CoA ligase [Bacillus gobiensis]
MKIERPWLDSYPDEIPHDLTYENKPLHSFLTDTANTYPDHQSIYFLGKKMRFREVHEAALKLAAYLQKIGIKKGDRVALMLPNCPQAVISYYGILFSGGIVVPTNPLFTERELEYQLKDSECTAIISLDLLYPRIIKMKKATKLSHLIITSIKDYLPFPKNILYRFTQKKNSLVTIKENEETHLFKRIIKNTNGLPEIIDIDPLHDIAVLQYTGGTTGLPKGAMLTHRNIVANTKMCGACLYKLKKGSRESTLGIVPFFHVYGMTTVLNYSVLQAFQMILLPKFDALDALKTIHKLKPSLFPGAPTIYIALLNHPDENKYDLSSIDTCISGSASLPVEVKNQFEKATGGKLVEGYGLSEASPVTHTNFMWGKNKPGSIGCPWPGTDAAIYSEETGGALPPYERGELIVKGPQVMKGYWNNPEETAAVLRDGWLFTGDIAYMDEEGFFYIVDRKKDIIIASGYNIYPREIEEVFYEHEAIREVIVAGIPDPYRGETVKAYVVLKQHATLTEKELDEYARTHLAPYKVPKIYEFRDELPKTTVGKILRRALIEEEKAKMNH